MTLNTSDLHTSTQILDAYVERSWRSNAERQRAKGVDFVIGKRDGVYLWNKEGTHRVIDCGTAGGVHSLGHRHPEVLAALRGALDDGADTGLWSVPNAEYLTLQARLAKVAPTPALNRSVITLCSTLSVDLATAFAFRITGRQKIAAYRHGYHGHTGFAALVTGSPEEGIIDHYNLPAEHCRFFETYGDLTELNHVLDKDIAAIILEPMDYETFGLAARDYFKGIEKLCRERGVLLIVDETRTGLGRSGKLWACETFNIEPDMMVTGKGLSGGLYPASALLMRQDIYERCMNAHKFAYISSLGGNEISCRVADKVVEISSRPETLEHASAMGKLLRERLKTVCDTNPDILTGVTGFGCLASVTVASLDIGRRLYRALFANGVLCHSVCEIDPAALKFLPPLVITAKQVDEIVLALERSILAL
jgi:putrescine aminotransferase